MVNPILWLVLTVIDIYFWIILATVIMSWLVAFGIINGSNPYVRQISYALKRLTEGKRLVEGQFTRDYVQEFNRLQQARMGPLGIDDWVEMYLRMTHLERELFSGTTGRLPPGSVFVGCDVIWASAASSAAPSVNRSSTARARQRSTSVAIGSATLRCARGSGGGSSRRATATARALLPTNGRRPVSISNMIAPNA